MDAKKNLLNTSNTEVSRIYKTMLVMLEDMKMDHDFHYAKLYEQIPKDYHAIIDTANHFTPAKVNWVRKRILDVGNESIRNINSCLDNYTVRFVFK
jgi:glucan phosphorylase